MKIKPNNIKVKDLVKGYLDKNENVEALLNELNEIQDRDYHFCIEALPTNQTGETK